MIEVEQQISPRHRLHYLGLIFFTIIVGLFSRTKYLPYPDFLWVGDLLYGLLIFFVVGFLYPERSKLSVGVSAFIFCCLIEFSQLYQADWILLLRETKMGSLILGHTFLWTDLMAYAVGAFLGILIEWGDGRS
jgi:Protein of unknown function (DUF2809).